MNIPEIMKIRKSRRINFFEKLYAGYWWFGECFSEWYYCMTHPEDTGGDFFCHICTDYVSYEETTYYTTGKLIGDFYGTRRPRS